MTYDGHGRLKTKHVPEQNTGTATVWAYNADDSTNTVTDARGAVTTFSYAANNRKLVTSVSSALTGQPNVNSSFTYDAAGNRMSMTDGLGSVTYTHNQLSQLTSETRAITGVGNFTLNYAYNLSGQLSSITDPFGALVGYSHDKVGRISAVTGSNFASVTSYASNLQYRAWGALESLTYGNSKTLVLGYDQNLRVSTYEIPGLMKKNYQYYDDGRLKFSQDQLFTNSKFDRLYKYDHVGRTTIALSGAEARGEGPTDDRPYNETMVYDAMGHLTLRELRHWDRYDTTGTATYINNRAQYFQYDADGRLLSGISYYSYDAAGRISTFGDGDPYESDQQLDGDGRRVKSTLRSFDPNTSQWITEKVTYFVYSSVIGEVISEVGAQGAKERSFVFAGGKIMAIQTTSVGQTVSWEHYDATGANYRPTNPQGQPGTGKEMDPMGANADTMKPLTWPQPTSPGKLEPHYGVPELNSAFSGCILDDIPVPCDILTNDSSVQCENNQCKKGNEFFRAFADRYSGYLPADARYLGRGIALSETAAGNSLNELAGVVTISSEDPTKIEGTGNTSNCHLSVSFESGTNYGGDPNLKNGPGTIVYMGKPNFGLGFTVTGYAKGGIGRIGKDSNPQNPKGGWVLEQWTAAYIEKDGKLVRDDKEAWLDISQRIPYKATGDDFSYYDHPGASAGWGINRYNNFFIKVYNGKEYCEVAFHFTQRQQGPGYELRWYKGLR
jgi:YD repeat-containing protein